MKQVPEGTISLYSTDGDSIIFCQAPQLEPAGAPVEAPVEQPAEEPVEEPVHAAGQQPADGSHVSGGCQCPQLPHVLSKGKCYEWLQMSCKRLFSRGQTHCHCSRHTDKGKGKGTNA